jgi:hypothetical protein
MMFLDTNSLILTRRMIIFWVTIMTVPFEKVFDEVEDALEKRGVHLTAAHL